MIDNDNVYVSMCSETHSKVLQSPKNHRPNCLCVINMTKKGKIGLLKQT